VISLSFGTKSSTSNLASRFRFLLFLLLLLSHAFFFANNPLCLSPLQFPIEMSLPWILTDHILSTLNPEMTESAFFCSPHPCASSETETNFFIYLFFSSSFPFIISRNILYPLDLYNDAAQRALHKLKTRYLYDEIEAEVNLAFDQFIFKLSQNVFFHYKSWASSVMIQKGYKAVLEESGPEVRYEAPRNRYKVLLQQRHFQLLGRSIDISQLLVQRMTQYLKKSIETAIHRFEAADLTQILVRLVCGANATQLKKIF